MQATMCLRNHLPTFIDALKTQGFRKTFFVILPTNVEMNSCIPICCNEVLSSCVQARTTFSDFHSGIWMNLDLDGPNGLSSPLNSHLLKLG